MNTFKDIKQEYIDNKDFSWITNNITITDNINIERFNTLLKTPVMRDVLIGNKYCDLYINSFEQLIDFSKIENAREKEKLYIQFANIVKERIELILKSHGINVNKNKIVYTTAISEKTDNYIRYRVFYISPDMPTSGIDFTYENDKNILLKCILSLHLKGKIISNNGMSVIDSFSINEEHYIISFFEITSKEKKKVLFTV